MGTPTWPPTFSCHSPSSAGVDDSSPATTEASDGSCSGALLGTVLSHV